jgi:hypothetical protein
MEASCREAPWPCAGPNAAPAQNRPAKIVLTAVGFPALLIGKNADMDDLPIFIIIVRFSLLASGKSTSNAARDAASARGSGDSSSSRQTSLGPSCLTSPEAPSETGSTFVDAFYGVGCAADDGSKSILASRGIEPIQPKSPFEWRQCMVTLRGPEIPVRASESVAACRRRRRKACASPVPRTPGSGSAA